MAKTFVLHFRYREDGVIGPIDYKTEIHAKSLKDAKTTGKSWEGTEPRMRWLYGVSRKE